MEQPTSSIEQVYPRVQTTFFGRVIGLFGLAMAVSAIGTYTGFLVLPQIMLKPGIIYALFFVELALVFTSRLWSSRMPWNYVLFSAFTFITGLTLAPLLALTIQEMGGAVIVKALSATALMFGGMAVFGLVTKRDLSRLSSLLFMLLIGMLVVSLIGIFVPWSNTFEMIFSGVGVGLFAIFTAFDFQRIKERQYENAFLAAMHLYLDIFNLFIFILRFMRSRH